MPRKRNSFRGILFCRIWRCGVLFLSFIVPYWCRRCECSRCNVSESHAKLHVNHAVVVSVETAVVD